MMRLDLATAEYIGARAQQQDQAAAVPLESGAVLVLADGLGGHESGAEASRIVVETFREASLGGRFDNPETRRQALRETVDRANARIGENVDPSHGHRGMASTVVAAVVAEGEMSWISVGDSHLYLWRGGRLAKLNEDHSQAGLMVRSGQYHPSDPEVQAVKSVLVSALTGRRLEIVDLPQKSFRIEVGDVLMLASDGLNTLPDKEIEAIVGELKAQGAVRLSTVLLETVRSRRVERQDNTTVAVARVLELPARAERDVNARPAPPKQEAQEISVPILLENEPKTERVESPFDHLAQMARASLDTKPAIPALQPKASGEAGSPAAATPVVEAPAPAAKPPAGNGAAASGAAKPANPTAQPAAAKAGPASPAAKPDPVGDGAKSPAAKAAAAAAAASAAGIPAAAKVEPPAAATASPPPTPAAATALPPRQATPASLAPAGPAPAKPVSAEATAAAGAADPAPATRPGRDKDAPQAPDRRRSTVRALFTILLAWLLAGAVAAGCVLAIMPDWRPAWLDSMLASVPGFGPPGSEAPTGGSPGAKAPGEPTQQGSERQPPAPAETPAPAGDGARPSGPSSSGAAAPSRQGAPTPPQAATPGAEPSPAAAATTNTPGINGTPPAAAANPAGGREGATPTAPEPAPAASGSAPGNSDAAAGAPRLIEQPRQVVPAPARQQQTPPSGRASQQRPGSQGTPAQNP